MPMMHAVWRSSMLILGVTVGVSQAGQPAAHHLLHTVPQPYDVPPPIIPISSTVRSGNASAMNPSIDVSFPTFTPQPVQPSTPLPLVSGQSSGVGHDTGTDTETLIETSLGDTYGEATQSTSVRSSEDRVVTVPTSHSDVTETFSVTSHHPVAFPSSDPDVSRDTTVTGVPENETAFPDSTPTSGKGGNTESSPSGHLTTDALDTVLISSAAVTATTEISGSISEPLEISTGGGSVFIPLPSSEASEDQETSQTSFTEAENSASMTGTSVDTETVTSETLVRVSSETVSEDSESGNEISETYTSSHEPESQVEPGTTGSDDMISSVMSSAMRQPSETFESPSEAIESIGPPVASDEPVRPTTVPRTTDDSTLALTGAEDMLVTGTDGTIATYVPERDPDYTSSTGTITTTDDNGDDVIIFPFGWFWRLDGGKGGAGAVNPPAPTVNPGAVNQPDEKEDDKNQDEEEDNDDDASTKDDDNSTVESTAYSTTEEPTTTTTQERETTTSSEECTAMTQPDCTRTISYLTSDGTEIMTEFGGCPTIVNCATETQATATVTISELIWAGGAIETPRAVIPEDALTREVDPDILDALEEEWAALFDREDSLFPGYGNATDTTATETATTDATTEMYTTDSEVVTTETSTDLISTTELTATTTTESGSSFATSTPSTLITRTRVYSGTSDVTSTTKEAIRTHFPCIIHGGPAVETPYCQCSTTVDGQGYYATTTLVDKKCIAYTEFPSQITSIPASGPITDEPVQEPITTTTDGTVLVWSAYVLDYINIPGVTKITQSVGVGEPSTVSTPLPSQTATDNNGGGQCGTADSLSKQGLREACDRAIDQFEDGVVYTGYTSRYSRLTKGILMTASFGKAACVAKFECDDYGIGMAGSDIKAARESAKVDDGVGICGHVYLSNSCKVILDYCTNCKTRG